MAQLRRRLAAAGTVVPLAADESVRKAEDPLRVAGLEAADVVVVKVAPLRGVRPRLAVAQACGLPVVVSSALDTSVGIAAGTALAARCRNCRSRAAWGRPPCWRPTSPPPRSCPWTGPSRSVPSRRIPSSCNGSGPRRTASSTGATGARGARRPDLGVAGGR